jgi:hypothetical protein
MDREQIIKAVDDYAAATGLSPSTICQYALRNRKVYDRLKDGGTCSFASAEALMAWITANPPKAQDRGAA